MAAVEYSPVIAVRLIYTAQSLGYNTVYHVNKDSRPQLESNHLDIFKDTCGDRYKRKSYQAGNQTFS